MSLCPDQAREIWSYDRDTGELRWNVKPSKRLAAGTRAGKRNSRGYIVVKYRGAYYQAHRIIWLIVHGQTPEMIDHVNGNPWDNRLCNLRAATPRENQRNRRRNKTSTSGIKGVRWDPRSKAWVARIRDGQRNLVLGRFKDISSAASAYAMAAKKIFGEFARTE